MGEIIFRRDDHEIWFAKEELKMCYLQYDRIHVILRDGENSCYYIDFNSCQDAQASFENAMAIYNNCTAMDGGDNVI